MVKENWLKIIEGLSLIGVEIVLYQKQRRLTSVKGNLIFTAQGISGPAALDLSRQIKDDDLSLAIDLFPHIKIDELDTKLQTIFMTNGKKMLRNSFDNFLPPKLINALDDLLKIGKPKTNEELKPFKLLIDLRLCFGNPIPE